MAYVLSNTEKQFDVGYDANSDVIYLTAGKAYTVVGGEAVTGGGEIVEISETSSKIIKNGIENEIPAYNINNNNYFKLRDLGEKFNFGVDYDETTNSVKIDTAKGYETSESETIVHPDGTIETRSGNPTTYTFKRRGSNSDDDSEQEEPPLATPEPGPQFIPIG